MKKTLLGFSVAAFIGNLASIGSAHAENKNAFCNRWHDFCIRTCPQVKISLAECKSNCIGRKLNCMSTGCYHFIRRGNQCMRAG